MPRRDRVLYYCTLAGQQRIGHWHAAAEYTDAEENGRMKGFVGRERHRGMRKDYRLSVHVLALLALAFASIMAFCVPTPSAAAQPFDDPTLTIVTPAPQNGVAEGPVGTRITIQAANLTPGDAFQLGYTTQDSSCASVFQPLSGATADADSSGAFTQTIIWPTSLASIGTAYYLCAQDTAQDATLPIVQSSATFRVDASSPPVVTLRDSLPPGASSATSTPVAGPSSTLYPGGQVTVVGNNYVPAGVTLIAVLSTKIINSPNQLNSTISLSTTNQQPIVTTGSEITATVAIPSDIQRGSYQLYLISTDGGIGMPSLLAHTSVKVALPPTPTIAPTVTVAIPTATPPGGTGGGGGGGTMKLLSIVGLAGLSVLLFVLGVILLASGASGGAPGPQPPRDRY
jgi:hypothetical protein